MRTCLALRLSQEDERAWHIRLADVRMCVCGHRGLSGDSNLGSAILWLHSPEQGPLPLWAQFSHQAFWGPLLGFGAPRGCSSQFRLGKCWWNEQTHGRKNEGMNEAVPLPSTAGLAQEDGGGRGAGGVRQDQAPHSEGLAQNATDTAQVVGFAAKSGRKGKK